MTSRTPPPPKHPTVEEQYMAEQARSAQARERSSDLKPIWSRALRALGLGRFA